MKRLWIALAILVAIFGASLLSAHWLDGFTGRLTGLLDHADQAAQVGDWDAASALTAQAARIWQQHSGSLHVVLRHADIDQVHISFEETQKLLDARELGEYAAANARLTIQLGLLREAEQLTLQNLF